MERATRIFGRVLLLGFCLVLIAVAGVLEVGRICGYTLASVQSDSMAPLIRTGDAVLIDRHFSTLAPGMVVSYRSPQDSRVVITHRITAVDRMYGTVTTKGDNAVTTDPAVPLSVVQGTVRYHLPKLGMALDFMRRPAGLILAVYLPALGIILSEIRRLQRYYKRAAPGHYVLRGY